MERCISVTSSGRSSTSRQMRCTSGLLIEIDWQIFFKIVVLPALGGETIKPRWPLPMGLTMSIARPVIESLPCSILSGSLG